VELVTSVRTLQANDRRRDPARVAAGSRYYAPLGKESQLAICPKTGATTSSMLRDGSRVSALRRMKHAQKMPGPDVGLVLCNRPDCRLQVAVSPKYFGSVEGINRRH